MTNFGGRTGADLQNFVERIERLEHEKANISEDIKEVYLDVKSNGFDVKIVRYLVGLRKLTPDERAEKEELISLYTQALGMNN